MAQANLTEQEVIDLENSARAARAALSTQATAVAPQVVSVVKTVEADVKADIPIAKNIVTEVTTDVRSLITRVKTEVWKVAGAGAIGVGSSGIIANTPKAIALALAGAVVTAVHAIKE